MQTRTRRSTARFHHPFTLAEFETTQPAGEYEIDEDEQGIETMSRIAWLRVATFIHLPAKHVRALSRQVIRVDHAGLEAALILDRQRHNESGCNRR